MTDPPTLVWYLSLHAQQRPQRPALLLDDRWVSWRELGVFVAALAQRWKQLPSGSRVVTTFANGPRAVIAALALELLGCVEVPLGPTATPDEVQSRVRRCDAVACLSEHDVWDLPDWPSVGGRIDVDRAVAGSQDRLILWTSGTTQQPRGVVLSAAALLSNALGKLQAAPQTDDDRRLTVLPLWHAYARTCDFGTWLISGGALAVGSGWDGLVSLAPMTRPTLINLVPAMVQRLLSCGGDVLSQNMHSLGLGRLRMLGCGGATLLSEDYETLVATGLTVIHGYGLTEAGPVVCSSTPRQNRAGCVGVPIAETEIRIAADQELWVRGPGVMSRYWGDPRATSQKLQSGWLHTGDLAIQETDGMIRILGRGDDVLVLSTGRKLHPLEIEQRLLRVPGVLAAVIYLGRDDRLRGLISIPDDESGVENEVDALSGSKGQEVSSAWQSKLDQAMHDLPRWKRPIQWLRLPCRRQSDELTTKGTLRRKTVVMRYGINPTTTDRQPS